MSMLADFHRSHLSYVFVNVCFVLTTKNCRKTSSKTWSKLAEFNTQNKVADSDMTLVLAVARRHLYCRFPLATSLPQAVWPGQSGITHFSSEIHTDFGHEMNEVLLLVNTVNRVHQISIALILHGIFDCQAGKYVTIHLALAIVFLVGCCQANEPFIMSLGLVRPTDTEAHHGKRLQGRNVSPGCEQVGRE